MGNVNQPFLSTGRYDVFFISTPPTFKLQLHVSGRDFSLALNTRRRPLPTARDIAIELDFLFVFYGVFFELSTYNYSFKSKV